MLLLPIAVVCRWVLPLRSSLLSACLASVGRVLSSVAAGHPGGTRSALDRFRETSIVDRRVRGDVPPHPLPSGERMFLIFPMKPRLGPVALVPSLAVRALASSRGRPNEAAKNGMVSLGICSAPAFHLASPAGPGVRE